MSISINDQNDQISTTSGVLKQTDTGGLVVASGVDVGKPTPVGNNGLIRYNTTNNALEVVVNGAYHTVAFTDSISGFLPLAGGTMLGTLAVAVGTVSVPNLTFSNSSTTGFFSPIANVIAATSNGTESLRIDNLGNVGIGKTPGAVRLDVTSAALTAALASTGSDYPLSLSGQTTVTPVLVGAVGGSFAVKTNAALTPQFTVDSAYSYTTTPFPGDNTTKIATTAFVTSALGISGTQTVITREFASSGTYTPTSGMVFCEVQIVAGGASGGGADNGGSAQAASGGGSGGYAKVVFTAAQIGASQSITIGSGGAGAAAGLNDGNPGGVSSFGSLITCNGGSQGLHSITPGAAGGTPGGAGGTVTVGVGNQVLILVGQAGGYGAQDFLSMGGEGGSNPLGYGGVQVGGNGGPIGNVSGQPGTGFGSGSGGAIDGVGGGDSAKGSAAGQPGVVIITEYIGLPSFNSLNIRTKLTVNTNFYVATTGNNSNNGLTAGTPWLTIQHAIDYISQNIDLAGWTATINVADGTYTNNVVILKDFTGGGFVILSGNTTTPANCLISISTGTDAIALTNSSNLLIQGFKIQTNGGHCISVRNGSTLYINGKMDFGAITGGFLTAHLFTSVCANIGIGTTITYTISGGASCHWYATYNSVINMQGATPITLTGTPAFPFGFARGDGSGTLLISGLTFSGTGATGPRYISTDNSFMQTFSAGPTYLPGDTAGTTSNGGLYV